MLPITILYTVFNNYCFKKYFGGNKIKANRFTQFVGDEKADARLVGGLVGLLILITIGILVFYEITSAVSINDATGVSVQADVNTTATTIFTLAPIVAIVLIASIILGVVTGFGKGGGGI